MIENKSGMKCNDTGGKDTQGLGEGGPSFFGTSSVGVALFAILSISLGRLLGELEEGVTSSGNELSASPIPWEERSDELSIVLKGFFVLI